MMVRLLQKQIEKLGGINLSKEASHDFNRVVDTCLLTTRIDRNVS